MTRSRVKRSASEMEMDSSIDEEGLKRAKMALIQQWRPAFHSSITTGATSLAIRKEQQQYQQSTLSAGGCSTWDQQHPIIEPIVPLPAQSLPIIQKPLPDLSKELSILPTLNDCSSTSTTPSTSDQDLSCCNIDSVSSGVNSGWSSMSSNQSDHQPFPQNNFDGCDPAGWIGPDNSYDLNTWKNLSNIKTGYDNGAASSSSNSSGFFEDNQTADVFINNGDIYRADDFVANPTITSNTSTSTAPNSSYVDYQLPQSLDLAYQQQDQNVKSESWCESFTQPHFQPPPPPPPSQQQQQNHYQVKHNSESRVLNVCYNNVHSYQQGGPHFRLQRPGNPTALFVPSGRSLTLSTFCNMLPRVVSYIQ